MKASNSRGAADGYTCITRLKTSQTFCENSENKTKQNIPTCEDSEKNKKRSQRSVRILEK
jgi:hypothetical protein